MGFGPTSQIIQPAEWVDPMDLNLYAKSMMYKQQMAEKNLQLMSDSFKSMFSNPAFGPDREKMAELENQFREQVSGMNFSDLGSLQTMSQIRGLIGEFSTNADLLASAKRGNLMLKMQKEEEKAKKNGDYYYNPAYRKLKQYYNQKDFIRDLPLVDSGGTKENDMKFLKEAKTLLTPDIRNVLDPQTGLYKQVKSYDPIKAKNLLYELTSQSPGYKGYFEDQAAQFFEENDPQDVTVKYYGKLKEEYQKNKQAAQQAMSLTKDPKKISEYQKDILQYDKDMAEIDKNLANPHVAQAFQEKFASNLLDEHVSSLVSSLMFVQEGDIKMDEATSKRLDYDYAISKMFVDKEISQYYDLLPYMTPEDRAKVKTSRRGEIDLDKYVQTANTAKAKAAALAANPNLAGNEYLVKLGGTYKELTDLLTKPDNKGNKTIVDSPLTQQKIVDILKNRRNLFPDIPDEVMETLDPSHIEIKDNEIEIDQVLGYSTTYKITQGELLDAVQDAYNEVINPKKDIGIGGGESSTTGKTDIGI